MLPICGSESVGPIASRLLLIPCLLTTAATDETPAHAPQQ
jgi:hypothetical protein